MGKIDKELFVRRSSKGSMYSGYVDNKHAYLGIVDSPKEIPNPDVLPGSNLDMGSTELFHHVEPRFVLSSVDSSVDTSDIIHAVMEDSKKNWGEYPQIGTYSTVMGHDSDRVSHRKPPSTFAEVPVGSVEESLNADGRLNQTQFSQSKLPGMN